MHSKDLNKADFLKALQMGTVDTGTGTLFGVPQRRAVAKNRLTLVISTGGSGKTAIQQAINTANQKLDSDYSAFIKFLVIDSATEELEALKKKGIDTLNTSSPMASIRLENTNRSVFYRNLLPKDFPVQSINSEGASQIRLIGKAKLYDQADGTTNDQLLQNKIAGYFAGDWAAHRNLPVDIMVLTGISGGNGSGTFIDIAVRAKKSCPIPANVTVYGYIMLPDTAERFAADDAAKTSLYRNGFAALKELESYESIGMEVGRKELMPSNNPANNVELSELNIPFNYPVLMSGNYDEAVGMIAETIVNAAADNGDTFSQASFYCNRDAIRGNKLNKDNVSKLGVLNASACPEDSHMYCSIGYAQASIPEKVVIPHVVGTVSRRLYEPAADASLGADASVAATSFCTQEKSLNRQDFQKVMRELLGISPNQELKDSSLWTKINSHMNKYCRVGNNNVEITFQDIVQGNTRQYINGFGTTAAISNAGEKMQEAIIAEFEAIKTKAQGIMKKYGPRVIQYLYDGVGNTDETGAKEDYSAFSIKTQIEYVKTKFLDQKQGVPARRPEAKGIFGKIVEGISKTELDAWTQAARTCEEMNVRYGVAQNMKGANGVWQADFVNPLLDLLWNTSRFADVLETISGYYTGVGKSLDTDDYRQFASQSGEINGINLCKDAAMYKWVRSKVNDKLANVKIQNVRDELIDDFYKNTAAWTSNEEGLARKEFDEVMSRVCAVGKYAGNNNGMNLTITDYFDHVLSTVDASQQRVEVDRAVREIFSQLMTKSKPCLKVKQGTSLICNGTIMLPSSLRSGESGTLISQAFQTELTRANSALSNLVFSDVVDSIVCYQTSVANALGDISDLTLWENAYENGRDNATHLNNAEYVSLHMETGYSQYNELTMDQTSVEAHVPVDRPVYPEFVVAADGKEKLNRIYGTGLSWSNYPSVNVARYGNNFDGREGTMDAAYRSGPFTEKINEAIRVGIIECEREGNNYKYYINLIPDDWKNLKIRGYKNKNRDGKFVRGKELFEYLKKQNPASNKDFRKQIALRETAFFGEGGFDFTEAIRIQHWEQARVDREHRFYMMRIMRKSTGLFQDMEDTLWRFYPIEAELEGKEVDATRKAQYKKFLESYLYGLINTDEKNLKWSAIVDDGGDTESIVVFSRRLLRELNDIEKKLINDGFKLTLVYDRYKEIRNEFELSDEAIDSIQKKVNKKLSDEDVDAMIDERIVILQDELKAFKDKFGNGNAPLDEMMDAYGLEDYQMDEVQPIIDFYEVVEEVIEEQNSIF